MNAPAFVLRTLDRPALTGPAGPVTFSDPRSFALLVLLALAGTEGVAEDTLLLRLTPDLTPARGRGTIRELSDRLGLALGDSAIQRNGSAIALAPGSVSLDVRRLVHPSRHAAGGRFLRGFDLPDSPEFGEWLEEIRGSVAPLEAASWRRGARPVALAAGLVLGAAALWWLAGSRASASSGFVPGGTVVLADVENATGDTLFDAGLTLATTVALEQSGHVGLLPRARVRDALARAGIADLNSLLTLDRAREAASREGIRFVISPRIAAEGDGYRLSAVLLDAFTDRLVKEATAMAESRAGVLPALDQVLREIRATLGETARVASERDGPLALVTTPSLEALRSYSQGARAWNEAEYALAEEFWHRALDQDTGFAMAMHSIGRAKAIGHARDSSRYYFARAFARTGRMTEWERLRIEESWASDRGDRDSAVKVARTIAERFPTAVSWYNYGTTLVQADRCEEATRPFERALALDSLSYATHINLATCSRRTTDRARAIRHYERAATILPASVQRGNSGYEFAGLLAVMGLTDSSRRQFGRIAAQSGLFDRTLGQRGLAFLALQQGLTTEAARHFEATIEIGRQQRAQLSMARGYLFLAMTHVLGGDTASAERSFAEMMGILRSQPIVPQMLALAGWGLSRAGRVKDAESVLLHLRQRSNGGDDDRAAEALLVGAIALARGQAERADSVLSAGPAFVQPQLSNLLRALALEATGKADSAARIRTVVAQSANFGTESYIEWIRQERTASGRIPRDRR